MNEKREIKSDRVIEELKRSCEKNGVEGYLFTTMDEKNDEAAYYYSPPKNIPTKNSIGLLCMITGRILAEFLLDVDAEKRREVGLNILEDALGFATHIEERETQHAKS